MPGRQAATGAIGGEGRATDLVSLPTRTSHLPREFTSFIGRSSDIESVTRLISSSPLVTVTGPSGMGKTRLALRVASEVVDGFADGVWLVEMALTPTTDDVAVVAEAVANVLDVRFEPRRSEIETLAAKLRGMSTLLILDNCEHVGTACSVLVSELLRAAPGLTVLATSQQPLGIPGEQVWPLMALSLPSPGERPSGAASDAVALFYARARSVQPGFMASADSARAITEICRRLDGIPLAIELAAARIAVLSPTEIAEHLDERFALLARSTTLATGRHQSLQSALDWSYELLVPAEQALFRRLSIFAGGAGLRHVTEVCVGGEVEANALVDLLAALVTKSLVVADTGRTRSRYRMLETIRAYAGDRLAETPEAREVAARHAERFVSFAEREWRQVVVDDELNATAVLETEHDNLRAALSFLLADGRGAAALRLGSALTPFWKAMGYFREGREWLEKALRLSPDAPVVLRSRSLWGVGMLAIMQGDLDEATSALDQSLALARGEGHQRAVLEALNLLAFISIFTRDPATALPLLEESVAMARGLNDHPFLLSTLALCGRAHLFLGDMLGATESFEECRVVSRCIGDLDDTPALLGLGWVALARGHHDEAHGFLAAALPIARKVDDHFETSLILTFLAELEWRMGKGEPRALLDESLELARAMGAPYPMARSLCTLGMLAERDGDHGLAMALVDEAIDAARRAQFSYVLARCLQARGELELAGGRATDAGPWFVEAQAVAEPRGDRGAVAISLRTLGRVDLSQGNFPSANAHFREALQLHVEIEDDGGIADALEAFAGLAIAQERWLQGACLMGAAEGLRQTHGSARSPLDDIGWNADVENLRAAVDADEMGEAWNQGSALSVDEAVSLALRSRGGRARPSVGLASLTTAERQAVDLAIEGFTNIDIAERMFVSSRTVQGHLSRAFSKLGVTSRRALREAVRQLDL